METGDDFLRALHEERERRRLLEESDELSTSMMKFTRAAWKVVKPHEPFVHNWHIDAICEHLEAVSAGEILRLQVWVPRGSMKSLNVSILWPAWEWTKNPWLRYWTASYDLRLSGRHTSTTRDLLLSDWYQARWPLKLKKADEWFYSNDQGGTRLATAPGSTGIGEHGHRILIDDAINALAADATSKAVLQTTNEWFDSTVFGSMASPKETVIVNIQQRLHERDLAAHLLELFDPGEWTVLCLPERYEENHPFAWRGRNGGPEGQGSRIGRGDPREEGELLWPDHRGEKESAALARALGSHRAAGQQQQRPAAREGELLLRSWWRYFDRELLNDGNLHRLPHFTAVIQSWDTAFKDKTSSDFVAGQVWGVHGGDRYLLRMWRQRMNLQATKTAMKEGAMWARTRWPNAQHRILIEKSANGTEIIEQLQREVTGIFPVGVSVDKTARAEAAAPDLESGNCFLPGEGLPDLSGPYESRCPADVVSFIDELAAFPNGQHDDQVDAWSQAMNWIRSRGPQPLRTWSAFRRRRAIPAGR